MLLKLLALMARSQGIATTRAMARELGVGEGLLERMLEDALRLGYLDLLPQGCQSVACERCSLRAACTSEGATRLWSLTDRGRRLLAEREPSQ